MARRSLCGLFSLAIAIFAACPASAEVERVTYAIQPNWGYVSNPGFDLITGTVTYGIKPGTPSARGITDIELAPRNARGNVEFSGNFVLLRPRNV